MVMPYLTFAGNCEEAFRFYAETFGGEILHMAKHEGRVLHAQAMLTTTGGISGSDVAYEVTHGNAVSLHVHFDNASMSGCVHDKYGFCWILSAVEA